MRAFLRALGRRVHSCWSREVMRWIASFTIAIRSLSTRCAIYIGSRLIIRVSSYLKSSVSKSTLMKFPLSIIRTAFNDNKELDIVSHNHRQVCLQLQSNGDSLGRCRFILSVSISHFSEFVRLPIYALPRLEGRLKPNVEHSISQL